MCSASAPKAAAPAPKKSPRVLLSRAQYGDLMIPYGAGAVGGADGGGRGMGGGGSTGGLTAYPGNFGRNAATGLRIAGSGN